MTLSVLHIAPDSKGKKIRTDIPVMDLSVRAGDRLNMADMGLDHIEVAEVQKVDDKQVFCRAIKYNFGGQ